MPRYLTSCGCGEECDQNDSHCPVCKDPITPVLEVDTETPDLFAPTGDSFFDLMTLVAYGPKFVADSLIGAMEANS